MHSCCGRLDTTASGGFPLWQRVCCLPCRCSDTSRLAEHQANAALLSCQSQVPGREAIRKKIAELSAAVAAGGGEGAASALSEAELAASGALDGLLTRRVGGGSFLGKTYAADAPSLTWNRVWPPPTCSRLLRLPS